MSDPIAEAKRMLDHDEQIMVDTYAVPLWVIEGLIERAELAGAVTPGPSARQIIRERMEQLNEEPELCPHCGIHRLIDCSCSDVAEPV